MRLFIFVCLFSLFLLLLRVMTSVCIGLIIVVWFLDEDGSLAWAESDDFACFFPALRAGGPEPVDVAVSAAWAGNTAQASHRCT